MERVFRAAALSLCLLLWVAGQAPAQAAAQATAALPEAPSQLQLGVDEGSTAARAAGTLMWTAAGFAGGLTLGLIGTGFTYALAGSTDTVVPSTLASKMGKREADYQLGFQQAYTQTLSSRRKQSALIGGLSGTAVVVMSYLAYVAAR